MIAIIVSVSRIWKPREFIWIKYGNIKCMELCMDKREQLIKYTLWGSIALDIILCACFVIGFSLGLGSVEIGFFMVGLVFRYGLTIVIISILLKLTVIALSFQRDTNIKRKSLSIAFLALVRLLIIGGVIWGIYFIGKVMTAVG